MSVTIPNSPIHGEAMISYPYGISDSGYSCGWHTGVDIVPHGDTPNLPFLYSCVIGEVVAYSSSGALGYHVTIKDLEGNFWRYCHMTAGSVRVEVGDRVTLNTIIGQMGSTGNVTGRHLHLEYSSTLAWNCNTFLNPCTKLGIPNVDNTIIYYDGSVDPPIPPDPPVPPTNKSKNRWLRSRCKKIIIKY